MDAYARRRGFSLIELLLVIFVLALLMSILFPALSRVRELARQASCASNLRNIGIALLHYADENRNRLPSLPMTRDGSGNPSAVWHNIGYSSNADVNPSSPVQNRGNLRALYMLVRGGKVDAKQFVCPSTDHKFVPQPDSGGKYVASNSRVDYFYDFPARMYCSYSYQNQWGMPTRRTDAEGLPVMADRNPMFEFTYVSASPNYDAAKKVQFPFLGNNTDHWVTVLVQTSPRWEERRWLVDPKRPESANSPNHNGLGQNVLYVDGSVKFCDTPRAGLTVGGSVDNIYTKSDVGKVGATGWGLSMPTNMDDATYKSGPVSSADAMLVP